MRKCLKNISIDTVNGFVEHNIFTLSAALAFYTVFSLAPLLLIIFSIISLSGFDLKSEIATEVQRYLGPDASSALIAVISNLHSEPSRSSSAGIFGSIFLIFSASCVFAQLQISLNIIWRSSLRESKIAKQWIIQRIFSVGMLLLMAILVMCTILMSYLFSFLFHDHIVLWKILDICAPLIIFTLLFAALFKIIPDSDLEWKEALIGGFFTSVMFMVGKYLISFYIDHGASTSAFGAAGSFVVLLLWIYYSSLFFFVGAEFTRALSVEKTTI